MTRSTIDKAFLAFVFLIPLMPRPTAEGLEKWIVPLLLSALIGSWLLCRNRAETRGGNFQLLILVLGFPMVAYVLRALVQGGLEDEILQLVSRLLFATGLVVMVEYFSSTKIPKDEFFKALFFGFLATSLLTIFCGITGIQILEEESIKPSRFIGLHKSTGIYRSYGEFAIMGCIAWAYMLTYKNRFLPSFWWTSAGIIIFAILISQSRNVYLVFILTTVFSVMFRRILLPGAVQVVMALGLIMIPVAVEVSLPLISATSLGRHIIGTGSILEKNVSVRMDQFGSAIEMMGKDPTGAVVGFPREKWGLHMEKLHGVKVAPHNHFLSCVLFLGIAGGTVWILGLYLIPSYILSNSLGNSNPIHQLVMICLLGTIVGLSFYEGFFSVVVMFTLSMAWSLAFSNAPESQTYEQEPVYEN